MQYLLTQEEIDKLKGVVDESGVIALELKVKELTEAIEMFVKASTISSQNDPTMFGGLSVGFLIDSKRIPKEFQELMREKTKARIR